MDTNEDKNEAAIQVLYAYRDDFRSEIELLNDNLRIIERTIKLLSSDTTKAVSLVGKVPVKASNASTPITQVTGYSGLKGQAAVELFLEENPEKWFKASVVAKELLRRGVQKTSKSFTSGITLALDRAAKKDLAIKEKRNKVFKYRSTTEPQSNKETKQ